MEESDIELWYEEQKQKLSEQYIRSIDRGMSLEQREKHFNREMEKLSIEYDRRHAKYRRAMDTKSARGALFSSAAMPFKAAGSGIAAAARFLGSAVAAAFRENYAQVHFTANIIHIRHTYKLTDWTASLFRPFYYLYAKRLKLPLIIIATPFVNYFKAAKQGFTQMGDGLSSGISSSWKYTKISAKFIAVRLVSAHKKTAARIADISKSYHEWQKRRVQESLDLKQKRKEEKEKKLKDRGQHPDAEPKSIDQADAASTV
jgi:hypothetical protein